MNDDTLTKKYSDSKDVEREVKQIVVEVKDKVGELKDRLVEAKDAAISRGGSTIDKIRTFATANPLKAVAIAFAVGYFGMRVTRPLRWL